MKNMNMKIYLQTNFTAINGCINKIYSYVRNTTTIFLRRQGTFNFLQLPNTYTYNTYKYVYRLFDGNNNDFGWNGK